MKDSFNTNNVHNFHGKNPYDVKDFIDSKIFAVGTIGVNNLPNISPRIFFKVEEDAIYWLDFLSINLSEICK